MPDSKAARAAGPGSGSKKKGRKADAEPQDLWPCRSFQVRQWGHTLEQKQGSHQASVRKLLNTLKDGRTLTEQPLRLSALQRLTPAACTGHRGALAAQGNALMDRNKAVRECALDGLWEAAGNKRPEEGGAVHATLQEVLPPADAPYRVESRRAAADALMRLGPKGDEELLSVVRGWLKDEDAEVRALASQATGIMSLELSDLERIAPMLQDKNWRVAKASIEALERISGGDGLRHRCKQAGRRRASSRGSSRSSQLLSQVSRQSSGSGKGSRPNSRSDKLSRPGSQNSKGSRQGSKQGSKQGKTNGSKTMPNLLEVHEKDGESRRPSTASTKKGRLGSKRSAASPSLTPRDTGSRPATGATDASDASIASMPVASAALLAATSALAQPCLAQGRPLMGLPRVDAVAALRRIAPFGHEEALEAVACRLRDTDHEVRREAAAAVAELAPGNQQQAVELCGWAMEELDWRARGAAAEALAASALPAGDEHAISVVTDLLETPEWGPRRGACGALRALVEAEDPKARLRKLDLALEAIAPKLQHEHWSVRRKAIVAVASTCEAVGGHRRGLRRVKDMANDSDEQVRLALAANLGRIAPLRCKEAVLAALHLATQDQEVEVRVAALLAVEELCGENRSRTRKAVRQVAKLYNDPDEEVRQCAKRVMSSIGRERRCAIDALALMLQCPNEQARLLAADTFSSIVGKYQPRAQKRTMRLFKSSDTGVREAAARAMATSKAQEAQPQDPAVVLAASTMAMKWRRNRFTALRGNLLSPEEKLANYAARGEDPNKDKEWEDLFGPRSQKSSKSETRKGRKGKKKKRKNSQNSSTMSARDNSSLASESERGDDSDGDTASVASKKSDASSRVSKSTNQSSMMESNKYKGKSNAEIRRLQAEEERERKAAEKDRHLRLKELQTVMESSDEETFSESGTDEESDNEDMLTAVEKILAGKKLKGV